MGAAQAAAVTGGRDDGGEGHAAAAAPVAAGCTATRGRHDVPGDPLKPHAGDEGSKAMELDSSDAGSASPDQPWRQRFGTTGFAHAGPFSKMTYLFVAPLVAMGARNKVRRCLSVLGAATRERVQRWAGRSPGHATARGRDCILLDVPPR